MYCSDVTEATLVAKLINESNYRVNLSPFGKEGSSSEKTRQICAKAVTSDEDSDLAEHEMGGSVDITTAVDRLGRGFGQGGTKGIAVLRIYARDSNEAAQRIDRGNLTPSMRQFSKVYGTQVVNQMAHVGRSTPWTIHHTRMETLHGLS